MKKLAALFITAMFVFSSARAADSGKLECTIYNHNDGVTAHAIITYGGAFIRETTKAHDLEIWHKVGHLTLISADQRKFEDHVWVDFDGPHGKGSTPQSISGFYATATLSSGRFTANKWGYWMSEISCTHEVSPAI